MSEPALPSDFPEPIYVAFDGERRLARGSWPIVSTAARRTGSGVLIFAEATGKLTDLDPRAPQTPPDARSERARAVGRPKLGVVAREVTLLPRHWEWLAEQPGGASVTLRKLVEAARRDGRGEQTVRAAREAAYRFMSAMAGDRPGFEEASRALFAGDTTMLKAHTEAWPVDIRDQVLVCLARARPDETAHQEPSHPISA